MLIIRPEQVKAFSSISEERFRERVAHLLQNQFGHAATEQSANLVAGIALQIERARGYGLLAEDEVAVYVVTAWLLGEDFDEEFPAAEEVLTSTISGAEKAVFLEHWSTEMIDELEREA